MKILEILKARPLVVYWISGIAILLGIVFLIVRGEPDVPVARYILSGFCLAYGVLFWWLNNE